MQDAVLHWLFVKGGGKMRFSKKEIESANTVKKAVCLVIDKLPNGYTMHGWELKQMVSAVYPDCSNMYVDTILRIMRDCRRSNFICIKKNESLYKKIA